MKRRITVVLDESRSYVEKNLWDLSGITVEAAEDVPEPDRVQEFRVRIVMKAEDPSFSASEVRGLIQRTFRLRLEKVIVAEVES